MFKFKKIVSLFLALVLTLGTASSAFAADDRVSLGNMEITGVGMTVAEFKDAFAASVESAIIPTDYDSATLNLNGIVYTGDELTMNATLTTANNAPVEFEFGGKLYDGYKQEMFGADSFIVDAESSNADVQSLLFEVVTNNQDTDALIDPTLSGVANIKVYVKYNNLVYMFEGAVSTGFSVIANGAYERMTAPEKDLMWFIDLVDSVITTSETDIPVPYSIKNTSWFGKTYQITMDLGTRQYIQTVFPFGYIAYPDVIDNGNHTWKCTFNTCVRTTYNGAFVDNVDSIINFTNVSIGANCGENTEIIEALADGVMVDSVNRPMSSDSVLDLVSCAGNKIAIGVSAVKFFADILTMGHPRTIKLGGIVVSLYDSYTTEASVTTPNHAFIRNNGYDASKLNNISDDKNRHWFSVDYHVRSIDDTNMSTSGKIHFKWDVIKWSTTETIAHDDTATMTINYSTRG